MAKSTTRFLSSLQLANLKATLEYNYNKRYKTLFISSFVLSGFDYGEAYYLLSSYFLGQSLASFKIKGPTGIDTPVAFQPFTGETFDIYSNPLVVRITPTIDSRIIPKKPLINNTECVLLRPFVNISAMIDPLIKRLVDIDATIQTNLKLHKMPFIISSGNQQLYNAINNILDDKQVITLDNDSNIKGVSTNTPYIIDKLQQYKIAIETEILSLIGIKGQKLEKMAQMTVDEVTANDEEVNNFKNVYFDNFQAFFDKTNELFGTNYKIELNNQYDDDEPLKEEEADDKQV